MANIKLQTTYICKDDCEHGGCPHHLATLEYQSCSDAYKFVLGHKVVHFKRGELEAVISLLRSIDRTDSVNVDDIT